MANTATAAMRTRRDGVGDDGAQLLADHVDIAILADHVELETSNVHFRIVAWRHIVLERR